MTSVNKILSNEEKLHRAVVNRDIVNILEILEESIDLKFIDPNGNTFIHLAFRNCDSEDRTQQQIIDILQIFLDRGVDPNAANIGGFTVLHLAVVHRMKQVIKFLLNHKANHLVRDVYGNTLIHCFVKSEFEKLEKFEVETDTSQIIKLESAFFLNWLAMSGFEFDRINNNGLSPLHLAIHYNLQHIILILLKYTRHIDLNAQANKLLLHRFFECQTKLKKPFMKFGDFSLFVCNSRFTVEIVERLLDKGIPVDTINEKQETALHVAIKYKVGIEVLELLANRFSAVHSIDSSGKTTLDLIVDEWWKDSGVEAYLRIIRILIAKGADMSRRNSRNGLTPIQQAVIKNNLDLLRLLRESGADLNERTWKGENLLHLAQADEKIIEFLVKEGVDVNGCDNEGMTPLHAEVWQRCSSKVKLLLKFGANVDILDNNGFSILRKAICQRNLSMVKELLNYGVDICDYEILRHFPVIDKDVRGYLLRHIIKMSTACFPDIEDCERAVGHLVFGPFREECRRELASLKKCFIDDSTSLLDFLQMDPNRKCAYIKNRKLKNLLNDPTFGQKFPNYSMLLLGSYLQTVRRKVLLKPAECAWYKLTGIFLPHVCVDRILAHLSNVDLLVMIKRSKKSLKRKVEIANQQQKKRPKVMLCVFE